MATALENARLYGRMVDLETRRSRELAIARQIQDSLLPDHGARGAGPGDRHRLRPGPRAGRRLLRFPALYRRLRRFRGGDVAGKATGAALYAAMSVGLLRGHAMEHPYPPSEMLAHLNEHLVPVRAENRFLALALAIFDPPSRTLIYGGAAFPWPRLVRDGKVRSIEEGGLPLGLFEDAAYSEVRVQLRAGRRGGDRLGRAGGLPAGARRRPHADGPGSLGEPAGRPLGPGHRRRADPGDGPAGRDRRAAGGRSGRCWC